MLTPTSKLVIAAIGALFLARFVYLSFADICSVFATNLK